MSAETQITNLLYRYAEYMDSGDLAGAASLFEHARLRVGGPGDGTVDAAAMLALWKATVVLYPNGTPRTKHLVTNPIVEVDEDAGTASCRSYYTVLQQTDDFPLQPIVAGRYHDRFERVDGAWRFCFRDYTFVDMMGDLSHHLTGPITPGP
jgi:3-phenylpropionate/cinnamic acid dioxygenase small subunit